MDRQSIDQTASELLLHRVLWLILLLRAMLLHVALAIVAVVLYFAAGARDLYPLATGMIEAMRAQAMQNRIEGLPITDAVFAVVAAMVFLAVLLWLRWVYLSITQVRRGALRLQVLVMVVLPLASFDDTWTMLAFAHEHLPAGFAMLAALGTAASMFISLSVVIALWTVSRAPEKSSLLATLDPRLTRSRIAHLNKLLDLPRTPLRTPGTAAAYALALAGAILLIASMMYLVTFGGWSNKLGVLHVACANHADLMPLCVAQASHWAWTMPWFLLLALVGVKGAALLRSWARRLGGLSVGDVLKPGEDSFVLYLRPFDADEIVLPKPRLPLLSRALSLRPFPVRIEEELFDVADGYRPLIAIGKPGTAESRVGGVAYRSYLDDASWQGYALDKIRRAERIVMILKNTDGVRWEFERVIDEGAIFKTLFLFEPAMKDAPDWAPVEQMVQPLMQRAGLPAQPFRFASRPIGFFFQRGALVEVVNANWTATSYRTAFSFFLAEPLGTPGLASVAVEP